ncbi:MAG: type II toxin-antitoxin system RelE/ParE family toxin [Beijerinckiaceae bacterium]|nr:type II toxin-antitoxin system RelE/ParE family toxin [Beijerinckiaceae bacterium]
MARLAFTASSTADLDGILSDLNVKAGRHAANLYGDRFRKNYDRLADHPASGAPRPTLGPNVRIAVILPYIVIYRYIGAEDLVTVLRIVHGRRKIAGRLLVAGQ